MKDTKYGIVCLDLDETLFHTKNHHIYFRPKLVSFLQYLHKYFYLVVFTAATKEYADSILNKIKWEDKKNKKEITAKNIFELRLYRSAVTSNGKDLKIVLKRLLNNRIKNQNSIPKTLLYKKVKNKNILNLENIILIDNLVHNFLDDQFFNGIPIKDFYKNKKDNNLVIIQEFMKGYLKQLKSKKNNLSLKSYLYNNLYKINPALKIEYHKPQC
jgi:TFIIF-interacting CTD phosphatase-like protein